MLQRRTAHLHDNPKREAPMLLSLAAPDTNRQRVEAKHLPGLLDAFLDDRARVCRPITLRNYRIDLEPFRQWWIHHAEAIDHVLDYETFEAFIAWMETEYRNGFGQPSTSQTIWRSTKRVRQFLRWLHDSGYIPVSIFELCRLYPDVDRLRFFPDVEELQAIVEAAGGETRLRDAALAAFAISTGARRIEIAEAKIRDLHFEDGHNCLCPQRNHAGWIRFRRVKGDSDGRGYGRISVFDTIAGLLLKCYLRSVNRTDGYLFEMSDQQIRNIVMRLGAACGITEIHPHAFRYAFIDHWTDTNADAGRMSDLALKLQVGHTVDNKDVTNRYVDTRNERKILQRIRRFHTSPLLHMTFDWHQWPVSLCDVSK